MAFLYSFFLLPLFFSLPEIVINWASESDETITIVLKDEGKLLQTCIHSGLEMQYHYELQLCKRRPFWFDTCQEPHALKRLVHFDPISRNYEMLQSWQELPENEKQERFSTFEGLRESLLRLNGVSLAFVSREDSAYVNSLRSYVSVRVTSSCKGEYDETFVAFSQLLTLGQIQLSGFDTGWVDFRLNTDSVSP